MRDSVGVVYSISNKAALHYPNRRGVRVVTDLDGAIPALRARRQHSDIVAYIGSKIVGGEYPVGGILPREEEFAAELAIGRSVVREAVRVLASKGLVEARPKRGTQVLPTDRWQMLDPDVLAWRRQGSGDRFLRDLVDLRAMIEPAACALAAERATDTELELIAALAREMQHTWGDEPAFIEADMRFHRALLQAAHNDLLAQIGVAIETGLRISLEVTVSMGHGPRLGEHAEVAAAIAARAPAKARKAMSQLIELNALDIAAVLGEGWAHDQD